MFAAIANHRWCSCRVALGLAALAASAWLGGCNSYQKTQSYEPPAATDDDFSKGANRPPSPETLYRMSKILEAQHKDEQCESVLRNCIQRYPQYMPAYAELSQLQVRQRKVPAAMATLQQGLALQPKSAVLLNDMGMCHMLQGEYEGALEQFRAAHEAAPDDARYTANMALAAGMLGRYDEALDLYQQIEQPGPAHYNVAVVAEARNDMDRANEEYAIAQSIDSKCKRKERSGEK
jgi:tetratricopeptide (TPR) repeat protein